MEVILKEGIAGLGKAGELVKVKAGFARNFLLPQKKAVVADSKNIGMLEHQKRVGEAQDKKLRKVADDMAARLSGLSITIAHEAGEEDKLFGSVGVRDISAALKKEGISVDKRLILLKEPIKQIGTFDVSVRLHPEVNGTLKVWVVRK